MMLDPASTLAASAGIGTLVASAPTRQQDLWPGCQPRPTDLMSRAEALREIESVLSGIPSGRRRRKARQAMLRSLLMMDQFDDAPSASEIRSRLRRAADSV